MSASLASNHSFNSGPLAEEEDDALLLLDAELLLDWLVELLEVDEDDVEVEEQEVELDDALLELGDVEEDELLCELPEELLE